MERVCVILDEIHRDVRKAVNIAARCGIRSVELRTAYGKNVIYLNDRELSKIRRLLSTEGLEICALATPLFKCFFPGEEGKVEPGDLFGVAEMTYDEHLEIAKRVIEIADFLAVDNIRCFTFWAAGPLDAQKLRAIAELLLPCAKMVTSANKRLLIENEPSCYVKYVFDAMALLKYMGTDRVFLLWDPANGLLCGEDPLQVADAAARIAYHVHVKNLVINSGKVRFVELQEGIINYESLCERMLQGNYAGMFSLEPQLGAVSEYVLERMVKYLRSILLSNGGAR